MKKEIDVELRLPQQTIKDLQAIAKAAGVKVNTVAKVMLAIYLHTNRVRTEDYDQLL
jgi:hypothetical protein